MSMLLLASVEEAARQAVVCSQNNMMVSPLSLPVFIQH